MIELNVYCLELVYHLKSLIAIRLSFNIFWDVSTSLMDRCPFSAARNNNNYNNNKFIKDFLQYIRNATFVHRLINLFIFKLICSKNSGIENEQRLAG